MNKIPGFTAQVSVSTAAGTYRGTPAGLAMADRVVAAIPPCRNCDYICDLCFETGRACGACYYCSIGNCDPRGPGE
jgi:hypothetical protein